nr:MAG TPA: SITE SPECIFIC RECOMBINASE XERD [Caudoviricetes sp.]
MKYSDFPNGWAEPLAAYKRFLLASGRSSKTVRLRLDWLARFARTVDIPPFQIDETAVIDWSSVQDWSQATRRSAHQSIKGFYEWAYTYGLTGAVPTIPSVRKTPPNPHPASDAALEACLVAGDWRVSLAARLAAGLGLRRCEVACINVDRDLIEDANGAALLVHGKGGKTRLVPLTDALSGELRRFNGFIFPGQDNGHVSPAWLGRLVSRAMPAGVTMHALRHRFTTRAYRQTRDLVALQKVLGHSSPETTLVYLQLADDALRRVVEAAA